MWINFDSLRVVIYDKSCLSCGKHCYPRFHEDVNEHYFYIAGKMDVWKVAKHAQCGILISFERGFNQALQINHTANGFARFQRFEMSPRFYTYASIITPWSMVVRLTHVGKSSYLNENQTVCQKTGELLIKNLNLAVRVDNYENPQTSSFSGRGFVILQKLRIIGPTAQVWFPRHASRPRKLFSCFGQSGP